MTRPSSPVSSSRAASGTRFLSRKGLLAGFVAVLAFALLIGSTQLLTIPDLALRDSQSRILAHYFPKQPARDVVIVGIDEKSFDNFAEPLALWHAHFGQFLQAMALAKPAVLGMDIVLPDRSFDWLVPNHDRRLLEGLLAARKTTNLVLGVTLDERGAARKIHPPFMAIAGENAFGFVMLPLDQDNVVRRYAGHTRDDGMPAPTLVGKMAQKLGIDADAGGIDYALVPPAQYIPFQQVIEWMGQGEMRRLQETFANKPVLLGTVLRYEDRHFQPVNLAPWEPENGLYVPGVTIQAQMLSSLINGKLVSTAPAAALMGMCLLASLFWFLSLRLPFALLLAALAVAGTYVTSAFLLHKNISFNAAGLMLTVVVALIGRWLVDAILEMRERRRLRNAFSGYVSPQIMKEILAGRLVGQPGGEMRTVCVLFADMRGFTTLSETMAPPGVMALLNRYFEKITLAIHAEDGTINCFMGDGIMAIFGAPKSMENPSIQGYSAARRMLVAVAELNAELALEGKPAVSIGIGLNVGPAIVGHVGSHARHDYSAIGDTTNVAARLEGLTKEVGYPLVCSVAVASAVGFPEGFADLGVHAVKGRSALQIYGWK